MLKEITDAGFNQVKNSPLPVILEFWSPNCIHCRHMKNTVASLAEELDGRVDIATVNILENSLLPEEFGVSGLPAFFLLKDGRIAARALGAMPKGRLKKELGLK